MFKNIAKRNEKLKYLFFSKTNPFKRNFSDTKLLIKTLMFYSLSEVKNIVKNKEYIKKIRKGFFDKSFFESFRLFIQCMEE